MRRALGPSLWLVGALGASLFDLWLVGMVFAFAAGVAWATNPD